MDKISQVSRVTIAIFSILCAIIGYLIVDKLETIDDGLEDFKKKIFEHEIRITKLEAKHGINNNQ